MIKIELYRYDTLVFGKVLEMNESLRNRGTLVNIDGFYIENRNITELYINQLYLNGKSKDESVFCKNYDTTYEAIEVCEKIKKGIVMINGESGKQGIIKEM